MRKFSIKLKQPINPSEKYDYNKSYSDNLTAIKNMYLGKKEVTDNDNIL